MNAATWLRVSTGEQDSANQEPDIARFVEHRGYTVVERFQVADSAWKGGKTGGQYRAELDRALKAAHAGRFGVLVVWSLDRLSREGAEGTLRILRQFRERGVTVASVQEPWLSGVPEITDVLVAFAGWVAERESARRSERVKAGLARRRKAGLPVGRQPGAKDRKPRKRSGYFERWENAR